MVLPVLQLYYPAWLSCSSSWSDILSETIFWVAAVSESCLHMCFLCFFVLVFGDDYVDPGVWRFFLWFLLSVWRGNEVLSGDIGQCELFSVDPKWYCYIVFCTYFGVQESNAVVLWHLRSELYLWMLTFQMASETKPHWADLQFGKCKINMWMVGWWMCLDSNHCMKSSAAKPDVEEPIAKPSTCLYSLPLNMKYIVCTHVSRVWSRFPSFLSLDCYWVSIHDGILG